MGKLLDFMLLVAAFSMGGAAVYGLRHPWNGEVEPAWLWLLLVGAGVVGGVALRRLETWIPDTQPGPRPVVQAAGWRRRLGWACITLALGFAVAAVSWLWPDYRKWEGAQWPWFGAIVLTLVGSALLRAVGESVVADTRPAGQRTRFPKALQRTAEVVAFVAIAALAVVLRTYRLNEIPAGIYVDETNGALDALHLRPVHVHQSHGADQRVQRSARSEQLPAADRQRH